MKIALLIISYNRLSYLKECFWSIENADLSLLDTIMVIDNNSDLETVNYIQSSNVVRFKDSYKTMSLNKHKQGISANLLQGYEYLFQNHDIVINLDSDALIRPDCINRLLELYKPSTLLTGFHSTTENRHTIREHHDGYCIKESVGGINFCIDKEAYNNYVKPALLATMPHGNWDHIASVNAGGVMCAIPSLVQHIGINSSLGHHDNPDVADDFHCWHLPDVTLFGVDSNRDRLNRAKQICTKWIKFGDVVTLNPPINSKEAYSEYIIKETYKHIATSHLLIFQHDGYVHNWKAWDNDWLQYDYIGAPWWYGDGMDVGNGGFSLRSKRLMEILATDPHITDYHPEDDKICRKYRKYLETTYNIKFAPIEVAERFSYEGYMQPNKKLTTQFGRHGNYKQSPVRNERYVIGQFRGLGDILFLVPLVRALIAEGNTIIWPIVQEYISIKKHFPDINFVVKEDYDLPYESKVVVNTAHGKWIPYRYAMELTGNALPQCMSSKYTMYGHDWRMWRQLCWDRDYVAEGRLAELLQLPKKYQLVNRYFGEASRGMFITPELHPTLPVVEMRTIEGFSLLDWCGVIEGASEIHTANSSLLYVTEIMSLDMPIHMYKRKTWGEIGYEHTSMLYTKDYILH